MINRNHALNQLKQVFDRIEPYHPDHNIGLRSLKNMGVWLSAYALTEADQKQGVIDALYKLAGVAPSADMKATMDYLSAPEVLGEIINDYKAANGEFKITVRNGRDLAAMRQAAREYGYESIIAPYLEVNADQDAMFVFDMSNTLTFQWANEDGAAHELWKGRAESFSRVGRTPFLSTGSSTAASYDLVSHHDRLYHVVKMKTLQTCGKQQAASDTFFVEPVNPVDHQFLQTDYFDIITKFTETNDAGLGHKLAQTIKERDLQEITCSEMKGWKLADKDAEYNLDFSFPELLGTLDTEERRLGAYAAFEGKTIGSLTADTLFYLGKRKLQYDEKGGKIENKEEFGGQECMRISSKVLFRIEYKINGPYMLVHMAPNNSDCYAFKITDPTKNLEAKFSARDKYTLSSPSTRQHGLLKPAGIVSASLPEDKRLKK